MRKPSLLQKAGIVNDFEEGHGGMLGGPPKY